MALDWQDKFKPEYDYARGWLNKEDGFSADWQATVRQLRKFMADDGFDYTHIEGLRELRRKVTKANGKTGGTSVISEDQGILEAVNAWGSNESIDSKTKMRAAVLKMLRHIYIVKKAGATQIWVHNLPTAFLNWASDHVNAKTPTTDALRSVLKSDKELFSRDQMKSIGWAAQHALAWCQKASIVLADAKTTDAKNAQAAACRAIVKRWFADPSTTDTDLDGFISTLSDGFKKMTATLTRGRFIVTDYVPLRASTDPDAVSFRNANAFTFRSNGEGLDVVYIETNFFKDNKTNIFQGQKHWDRIIVHETSHLAAGTIDVKKGHTRYAHSGIGPHAGFLGSDAVQNADSWACFAADCAGAMTDSERQRALKIA